MAGERSLAAASSGGLDWSRPIPAEPRGMKRATYEDVLNAPENKVAEILDGELFLSPRPAPRHAVAAVGCSGALGRPFDDGVGGPGGWWILDEPELHFGEQVVVPDLAGWRRERLPAMPDEAFFSLAPDWVCEVLSPSTERIDRGRKLRIYAEAGVAHAWLVNPVGAHARGPAASGGRLDDRRGVQRLRHRSHRALRGDRAGAGPPLGGSAGSAVRASSLRTSWRRRSARQATRNPAAGTAAHARILYLPHAVKQMECLCTARATAPPTGPGRPRRGQDVDPIRRLLPAVAAADDGGWWNRRPCLSTNTRTASRLAVAKR